ncbi:hypothetical protein FQR65_LT10699 [Abscondita terminalis]|nr:hypothetical protein FQR65_LT10699 [Abscondita terminalis]
MDIIRGKCEKVTSLLQKRDLERKLDIEKKLEDKKSVLAEHERIEFFEKTFGDKRLEIENDLNLASSLNVDDLPNHFDTIFKNILNLQKYGAGSKIFLRMYDIERCHETVHDLTTRAKELEEKLMPKKKFGFKKKSKPSVAVNGHSKDVVDFCTKRTFDFEENLCGFENKRGEILMLQGSEIYKKDVMIRNVENCVIKLCGTPSTLHLNQLKNCLVFSGPVSTSILAENCVSSKLVIACQQLSKAIIEDCSKILVAPYNYEYESIDEDFINSGLNRTINNWSTLDDFNWLNVERQSPNWAILNESERISNWNTYTLSAG